jgi:phospholipid-binding lipoprotein MlaA
MLNTRASAEGSLKFINEAALDPYVFTRESFLQWRNNLASDGKSAASSDFDEELLDNEKDEAVSPEKKAEPALNKAATNATTLKSGDAKSNLAGTGVSPQPNSDNKEFGKASQSFGSVSQSFENTAKSFEEAGYKLDKLKKHRQKIK